MISSNRRSGRWLLCGLAFCTTGIVVGDSVAQEQRGREIYFRGTANGKEILALLDGGQTRVNASVFPCASCHGADGRGKNEGGVTTPDITWGSLTKPYIVWRSDGRSRPPYTESSLKRAIALGMDSGGQELLPIMPRFQLSYSDANDLIAFLKQLGETPDPGVSESSIRIGVLLPPPERLPALHDAIRKSLTAYFDEINRANGIYGRRVELKFLDLATSADESAAAVRAWLKRESIFALAGSFLAKEETAIAPVLNETATPLLCAFVLDPDEGSPMNPYVFYLDAGLLGEVEELVQLAQKQFPGGAHIAIAAPPYEITRKLGDEIKSSLSGPEWKVSMVSPDVKGCLSAVHDSRPQIVFWLAPQFSAATFRECSDVVGQGAKFFLPGSFADAELFNLPDTMDGRVFVTVPLSRLPERETTGRSSAKDTTAVGWSAQESAAGPAVASARLLTWALQRAGRGLTRQKLLESLEDVYHLDLGSGFSVTYGPNRRIGGVAYSVYELDLHAHNMRPANTKSP